ncbi:DNA-directed RNA polymerases IV and V subunit 4-like isoform X2 [Macadamia integrifolia]|uniref:DNA-directed RNA polymerases IV and V subunit 4-like isoform X2 n=1 Tax=Macadamia integrifolia TaxID=60698 RepID=UPI001C528FFA|nr:DNA-directed RNA polymerases IV and V subunit 4-like isoform X2 [Macadamia integrifolia]
MAEKGGKGFSVPKERKISSKSPSKKGASLKGKDSSSKRGRKKVHFETSDSEDSPTAGIRSSSKSGGKISFESPVAKGDSSKGGKSDKTGKTGGKGTVPKEPTVLELKTEEELPKDAKCLMDCEAVARLQGIQDQQAVLSQDPAFKMPVSFDKGLLYAKASNHYMSHQSVRQVLQKLKRHGISDGEICMIANICPESVDEVFALVPSLKANRRKIEEPLKDVFYELAKCKKLD